MPWQSPPSIPVSGAYVYVTITILSPHSLRLCSDPDGLLPLSEDQKQNFLKWKRGPELVENPIVFSAALRPEDLVQGNPADCSVIASLVVCLHHHRRFGSRVSISHYAKSIDSSALCAAGCLVTVSSRCTRHSNIMPHWHVPGQAFI